MSRKKPTFTQKIVMNAFYLILFIVIWKIGNFEQSVIVALAIIAGNQLEGDEE